MKLGTLLLRDAVISLAQLEAALRAQVLYGGKLGTNLVELDFVDLDTLAVYLGRVTGLPVATQDHFDASPAAVIGGFDRHLAELYSAFPLGQDPQEPEALAVAVVDPSDQSSLEQLADHLDRPISIFIAPELRVMFYLERHYGIVRKARYVRPGTRRSRPIADERRRTQPPHGLEMPPAVRFAPRRRQPTDRPPEPEQRATQRPLDELLAQIDRATERNQIGDALVEHAVGRFDVAVAFVLRDANALGWRLYASSGAVSRAAIEGLSLPLGGASALEAAHDARATYRGPSPTAGRPVERRLWDALGVTAPPYEMLVVPVMVKSRVVNLVYAHVDRGNQLRDEYVSELERLAESAELAYGRLIQAAKQAT